MRRGSQHFLRSVKLEGVAFCIESERGGRNSAQLVADPDESAGRNYHRDDAASREIQHEVFHFAQFLILQVFHWRAHDFARLLNNAQVRPRFTGFVFTHDAVLAPCSVRAAGSYRLGGIFFVTRRAVGLLAVLAIDLRHLIGIAALSPLRHLELGGGAQFLFVRIQLKGFAGDIVMQRSRRHSVKRVPYANKPTRGQDYVNNPSRLHIHGQVIYLAQLFILVVFDFHPDEVAGLLPTARTLGPRSVSQGLVRVFCRARWGVGCFLGQSRERQDRGGGGTGDNSHFSFHILLVSILFHFVNLRFAIRDCALHSNFSALHNSLVLTFVDGNEVSSMRSPITVVPYS